MVGRLLRNRDVEGRLLALLALVVFAVSVAACGEDEDYVPAPATEDTAFLTLEETRSFIERGQLAVVWTGGTDPHLPDGAPPLVDAVRLESQSGREFNLFVFWSARDAKRAVPLIVDREDGETGVRAANVVAVFPNRYSEVDAYRVAADAMRRLHTACTGGGAGEERLRRLCFDPGKGGVPPEGEGVDRDEAAERERPIVVDGLHYDPLLARRLNPRIVPDEELVSGRLPEDGKAWFAVFLRVCNHTERTRTSASELALVDAFGARLEPADSLPASNPFAYAASAIKPQNCAPKPGSVAERVSGGALVLFEIPSDFLINRPIALEVTGESGERKRSILDI